MKIYLLFAFENKADVQSILQRTAALLRPYISPAFTPNPAEIWTSPQKRFAIVSWARVDSPYYEPVASGNNGHITYSGYVTDIPDDSDESVAARIGEKVEWSANEFAIRESSGGVATFVCISPDETRAVLWNTQPPTAPIYYTEGSQQYRVAGTRPLLTFLASHGSLNFFLEGDYLRSFIAAGYAVDGSTPYRHTLTLPADRCLEMSPEHFRLLRYPLPPPEPIPGDLALGEKIELFSDALLSAFGVLKRSSDVVVRLSGGKDSRTLAAALAYMGLKARAVTYGHSAYGEGVIAKRIADLAGMPFEARKVRIIADPIKAACFSNRETEGLTCAVAEQHSYFWGEPSVTPTLHGHGHLMRGGFARTMAHRPVLENFFLWPWTTEEANQPVRDALAAWIERRPGISPRDQLYWANHDLRLSFYLAPHYFDHNGRFVMIYPLLDDKVARVASALSMYDKVTERVVFGTIKKLCAPLVEVPLLGEIWRFDRDPARSDFPDGFESRQPVGNKLGNSGRPQLEFDEPPEHFGDRRRIRTRAIVESPVYGTMRRLITSEFAETLETYAASGVITDYERRLSASEKHRLNAFTHRLFLLTSLYTARWL